MMPSGNVQHGSRDSGITLTNFIQNIHIFLNRFNITITTIFLSRDGCHHTASKWARTAPLHILTYLRFTCISNLNFCFLKLFFIQRQRPHSLFVYHNMFQPHWVIIRCCMHIILNLQRIYIRGSYNLTKLTSIKVKKLSLCLTN
jgi:hypothetical protein